MAHKKCIEAYKKLPVHARCDCIIDDLEELKRVKKLICKLDLFNRMVEELKIKESRHKEALRQKRWENSKFAKKCKKIWNSEGKRFKAVKFICAFCDEIKWNQTYSVVDGLPSCLDCDELLTETNE